MLVGLSDYSFSSRVRRLIFKAEQNISEKQAKTFLKRSSLNSLLILFKMVDTNYAVRATLYCPFCTFTTVQFITHTHIHAHTQTTQLHSLYLHSSQLLMP